MAKTVFERTEKKYRLTPEQYENVLAGMLEHMRIDDYGMTTISSVYYDDHCDRMIRTSIERPVYKEKLRVRAYGAPAQDSTVYVELKKKFKGVVYKRRVGMSLSEAESYLSGGPSPKSGQIINEITWVRDFYKPAPRVYIAYDRIALESTEGVKGLRVTFDTNIRARDYDLSLADGDHGEPLLPEGHRLMEIKVPGAMPMWMCELLTSNKVYPSRFSKYGTFYQNLITKKEKKDV